VPAGVASRATRCAFLLALLAFVALLTLPVSAAAGIDDPPPAFDGPWIIEVGPEIAVIVDGQGSVAMVGEAQQRVQTCEATAGCGAFWEDGVGTVVIVDQSPAPASPPSAAASKGAAPR
jgi:hypothetical protein